MTLQTNSQTPYSQNPINCTNYIMVYCLHRYERFISPTTNSSSQNIHISWMQTGFIWTEYGTVCPYQITFHYQIIESWNTYDNDMTSTTEIENIFVPPTLAQASFRHNTDSALDAIAASTDYRSL